MSKFTSKRLLFYFLRGLLILVPLAITAYIIVVSLAWVDSLVPVQIPGLGLLIVSSVIILIGYVATSFIAKPVFEMMEELLMGVPLISLIYSSIKDLLSAFVGDKKKFNQPVLVEMEPGSRLFKMGFLTQENMDIIGQPELVAVYLPHSYNFSGNFYIVPRERITLLNLPSSDVMKFVVSGGVSGYPELLLAEEHARNQASGQVAEEVKEASTVPPVTVNG